MTYYLITHVPQIHAYELVGMGILISLLECVIPRRPTAGSLRLRWAGNFAVIILGFLLIGFAVPMFGYAWASYCAEHKWGLLNQLALPGWITGVLTFLAMDLLVYARHWLAHHSSLFWRLHRLHHTDSDIDFTTTLRFHPLDALFISALEGGLIVLLGASPIGVVCFRLISTFIDFTSHANMRIPVWLERFVGQFVITPDMHRTHHSQRFEESMSNYGNVLPLWDRCLGTYLAEPAGGHSQLQVGVIEFSERKHQELHWMLAQPFLSQTSIVPAEDAAIASSRDLKSA